MLENEDTKNIDIISKFVGANFNHKYEERELLPLKTVFTMKIDLMDKVCGYLHSLQFVRSMLFDMEKVVLKLKKGICILGRDVS